MKIKKKGESKDSPFSYAISPGVISSILSLNILIISSCLSKASCNILADAYNATPLILRLISSYPVSPLSGPSSFIPPQQTRTHSIAAINKIQSLVSILIALEELEHFHPNRKWRIRACIKTIRFMVLKFLLLIKASYFELLC